MDTNASSAGLDPVDELAEDYVTRSAGVSAPPSANTSPGSPSTPRGFSSSFRHSSSSRV